MFKVKRFVYGGLFIQVEEEETGYTAEFERWTKDPGVALFKCSDGEERLIPTCALVGKVRKLPKQDTSKAKAIAERDGFHLGMPCRSDNKMEYTTF